MKGKKLWRLSRTLSRRTDVRPIENDDLKYAWAAYKTGELKEMGFPLDLDAAQFKQAFETYVFTNANGAWTISAHAKKGYMPIGFALGRAVGDIMMILGIAWFPWASRRNIVEGTVDLFNRLRKQFPVMGFATDEHRPLYDVCCMHGIMERAGTSRSTGIKMAIYEGRNR